MKYLGSKNKIAKHLLPIILKDRKPNQYYVEPFMGGGNMIDKVEGLRIGNDYNHYLIEMWKALQNGWIPPNHVSEVDYKYYKKFQDLEDPAMVAFIGFLCSFSGKWFNGYARAKGRDFIKEGKRNILKQLPKMIGVKLYSGSFDNFTIPPNSIIYCDPPYKGTTGYKDSIDHDYFWNWCRAMVNDGHTVFISEYEAPIDFICVKEIEHFTNIVSKSKRIEKLFTFNDLY